MKKDKKHLLRKSYRLIFIFTSLIILGCSVSTQLKNSLVTQDNTPTDDELLKEAVKVAQGFSIAWQNENYGKAYEYFNPILKENKIKADFVKIVEYSQNKNKFYMIYDKVVLQDRHTAYAYYTFSGDSILQPKTPAVEMDYINGTWTINTFAKYFKTTLEEEQYKDFISGYIKKIKEELAYLDGFPQNFECKSTFDINPTEMETKNSPQNMKELKSKLNLIVINLPEFRYRCALAETQIFVIKYGVDPDKATLIAFGQELQSFKQKVKNLEEELDKYG